MCGIAGVVGVVSAAAVAGEMIGVLEHRGPDAEGIWRSEDGRTALGHRRLAIVGLGEGGAQPMASTDGSVVLVYNGELYNFQGLRVELEAAGAQFRGTSDTEVLLEGYLRWGDGIVARIEGMFAFAILDRARKRLLLARDRSGQKPLFFHQDGHRFLFASEIKALFASGVVGPRLQRDALSEYLAYGYTLGTDTLVEGVCKVLPGELVDIDIGSGHVRRSRYWTVPSLEAPCTDLREAVSRFEALLEDSVRRHLVADVPAGVLLSGGLDSSLITAMAARVGGAPVKTFTVTFPGHKKNDEAEHARRIAAHFGTEHVELALPEQTPDCMGVLARQFDEPIADHAIVPTFYLARRVREEVTVALGGDGGDELFGGYPHYAFALRQAAIRRRVPALLRGAVSRAAARWLRPGAKGRNHAIGLGGGIDSAIAHFNLYFDASLRRRLLPSGWSHDSAAGPEARRMALAREREDPVEKAMYADFRSTLPEGYLVKVDRASMLSSLEVRAPFLDDGLVDFAWRRVPAGMKVREDAKKILPRELGARLLPQSTDLKRKQGFTMPLAAWMTSDWGRYLREVLLDPGQDLFEHHEVERLFTAQSKGLRNEGRLFALAMLALWRKEYGVAL